MIKVYVQNNAGVRDYVIVDETATTPRSVLEEKGIDLSRGMIHLDGASMQAGDINKTFAQLGYDGTTGKDKAYLMPVAKLDNAGK